MKQIKTILKFSWHLKPYYIAIAMLSVVIAVLGQVTPFALSAIIDKTTEHIRNSNQTLSSSAVIVGILLFVNIIMNILENINGHLGDKLSIRLKKFLSEKYYQKLMTLPQKYFDDEHTGTIIGRLDRSIESITSFAKQFSNLFLSTLVQSAISLGIIAYFSWIAALILLVTFPIYLYFTNQSSKKWQVWEKGILEKKDLANGRFAEVVGQLKAVKSYVKENIETKFYKTQFSSMIDLTTKQSIEWHKYDVYRRFSQDIIFAGVLMVVVWLGFNKQITAGEVVLLFTLASGALVPLRFISYMIDNMQKMITGSKDYFKVMDMLDDPMLKSNKNIQISKGDIEFNDVEFSYDDDQPVLSDISFKLTGGQKLALVGESGEGKSTISNLILMLYKPTKGSIQIDSQNIADINPISVRENIAVVFQEPQLFSGSILDNIAYGLRAATKKQVEEAAKKANAHDFISKLKDSYDSEIGERGVKLSGGQKQRISIARAILKNAPILILDEATSSLDSRAELVVQEALDVLMKDKTTIIIAHRLSTISNVDTIVTIKSGKVDEIGSPDELAKTDGIYGSLLKLQQTGSKTSKKELKAFDIVG